MKHVIQYGQNTIQFSVVYTDRKTLGIDVFPDQSVSVRAPKNVALEKICTKVKKRARWILKQQRAFSLLSVSTREKQYVSGETFLYLGRQFRLKVVPGEMGEEGVKLVRGYFRVFVTDPTDRVRIRTLLEHWYQIHARLQFEKRLNLCCDRLRKYGIGRPPVAFRKMKNRWGSFTKSGRILLNPKLIEVPVSCIDYVIIHELCHFKYPNHSGAFYEFLSLIMPEWPRVKKRLEYYG